MAPQSSHSPAAILAEYTTLTIINYCGVAGLVLLLHEYLVTFKQEVELFWKRKLNGAALLFYLNRYSFLGIFIIYNLATYTPSSSTCSFASRWSFGIRAVAYFVWAAFSGLRAYALSWKWPLGTFVFILSAVPIGINLSLYHFGVGGVHLPMIGCEISDFVAQSLSRKYVIISRTSLIASDVILIIITWATLSRRSAGTRSPFTGKITFANVLLRDGTIYFVVLLILNILHLSLTLLSFKPAFQDASYLPSFTEPITAILVSRFLLDLQYANQKSMDMGQSESGTRTDAVPDTGSLNFERFVDSLGTSIVPGTASDEDSTSDECVEVEDAADCSKEAEKRDAESALRDSDDSAA